MQIQINPHVEEIQKLLEIKKRSSASKRIPYAAKVATGYKRTAI